MKALLYICILLPVFCFGQKFHQIPDSKIDDYNNGVYFSDHFTKGDTLKVAAFEVSDFVLYKEYKVYLKSVKEDSSEEFYISQLPDTNISISKDVYNKYITEKKYDNDPIVGICWDNIMNYCKWKTLKDNSGSEIKYFYRMPVEMEWLAAYNYYKENNQKNDLNSKYADWTMNAFDESAYNFSNNLSGDYQYSHSDDDPMVLKRKAILGSNYLYQRELGGRTYGYATIGYREIAFRLVKEKVEENNIFILKHWGILK